MEGDVVLYFQNFVHAQCGHFLKILLTLKAGCRGNNGKNWPLNPGTSSQSVGYSKHMANLASVNHCIMYRVTE